ncbi:MAG: hypothetical protein ACK5PP_16855 [Acidimicrobiales bacterium]
MQHTPYHGIDRMIDAVYRARIDDAPSPISRDQILTTGRLVAAVTADLPAGGGPDHDPGRTGGPSQEQTA